MQRLKHNPRAETPFHVYMETAGFCELATKRHVYIHQRGLNDEEQNALRFAIQLKYSDGWHDLISFADRWDALQAWRNEDRGNWKYRIIARCNDLECVLKKD